MKLRENKIPEDFRCPSCQEVKINVEQWVKSKGICRSCHTRLQSLTKIPTNFVCPGCGRKLLEAHRWVKKAGICRRCYSAAKRKKRT